MTASPVPAPGDGQDVRGLLDQLEQVRAKVTPGPWEVRNTSEDKVGNATVWRDRQPWLWNLPWDDAELIVAEHNAVPQLVQWAREREALRRAVLDLADSLDVDSCDPMPDERSRLLFDTAQRLRAITTALTGQPTTDEGGQA